MPVCVKCGKTQASAEITNRSPQGPMCKDKIACQVRREGPGQDSGDRGAARPRSASSAGRPRRTFSQVVDEYRRDMHAAVNDPSWTQHYPIVEGQLIDL